MIMGFLASQKESSLKKKKEKKRKEIYNLRLQKKIKNEKNKKK